MRDMAIGFGFGYRADVSVTLSAKPEWPDPPRQTKILNAFMHLLFRLCRSYPPPRLHRLIFQQTDIPAKNDAPLFHREGDDFSVMKIFFVQRVETQKSKMPGQFSQMRICDKFRIARDVRQKRFSPEDFSEGMPRIYTDIVSRPDSVTEIDRRVAYDNNIHFTMRNTYGFDSVLDGGMASDANSDFSAPLMPLEEIVQFTQGPK